MNTSNYDEFGNYIGPDIDESSDDVEPSPLIEEELQEEVKEVVEEYETSLTVATHYPSAQEVYGDQIEVLVGDVDTQPLSEPIVAPIIDKTFDKVLLAVPELTFDFKFFTESSRVPDMIRNVTILGNLHEGKSLLCDIFVNETHLNLPKGLTKFTDYREDEIGRAISVKSVPLSLCLTDTREKSWMINVVDSPGHPNFVDECIAALRSSDNAVIVVDALKGVTTQTKRLIYLALGNHQQLFLVLNCVDRLCLELRLPPKDAYFKLKSVVAQINSIVQENCELLGVSHIPLNPVRGNVAFASGLYGFFFTLSSFSDIYGDVNNDIYKNHMRTNRGMKSRDKFSTESMTRMLWGDLYFNETTRKFTRVPEAEDTPRSFVQFVLDPLWKLMASVLGEEKPTLSAILGELGVYLNSADYMLKTKDLLKVVFSNVFHNSCKAFTDMVTQHGLSPAGDGGQKLRDIYSGSIGNSIFAQNMLALNPDGLLIANSIKNFHRPDCRTFDTLVRIYCGTLRKGQPYKVLGPAYTPTNAEDCITRVVTDLWIFNGRYRVPIDEAYPGMIVLVGGLEDAVIKTVTIVGVDSSEDVDVETFKPLSLKNNAIMKVSCEPIRPSELPKMILGIRSLERSYLMLVTKVEDSGEHVLLGSGEVMMDCLLHDLRMLYGELEVKVSDPVVALQETVIEESSTKATARTSNGKNRITAVSSPLDPNVIVGLETEKLTNHLDFIDKSKILQEMYGWDALSAKSVWSFGPTLASGGAGTCALLDETLPGTIDKTLKSEGREFLVQGFQWAAREGPLIEEPIRQVKFRLLELELSSDPMQRPGGQIVPTMRRAIYSAFLLSSPRLMEPILFAEITCSANAVAGVYNVLSRRRGYVIADSPKAGTPLFEVHAYIPAIDAFGFETDVRTHTSGQAVVLQFFDHWSILPGDPLDRSIMLRPLEPAPAPHLARECTLKTRRRKGLTDDVHAHKIFDPEMLDAF